MDLDVSARAEAKTVIDSIIEGILEFATCKDHIGMYIGVECIVIKKIFIPIFVRWKCAMMEDGKLAIEIGFCVANVAVAIAFKLVQMGVRAIVEASQEYHFAMLVG